MLSSTKLFPAMEYVRDELKGVGQTGKGVVLAKTATGKHLKLLNARCQCSDCGEHLRQWSFSINPSQTFQGEGKRVFPKTVTHPGVA